MGSLDSVGLEFTFEVKLESGKFGLGMVTFEDRGDVDIDYDDFGFV